MKSTVTPLRGRRVLLVEDNAINRAIARSFLESASCEAENAYNGAQALDKLCAHVPDHFDLVMDLQMPVMDGYEAARHIRALHDPQLSAIPIVTMTANALAQDLERERACGVSRHLSKPIDLTALHAALCEVLREN